MTEKERTQWTDILPTTPGFYFVKAWKDNEDDFTTEIVELRIFDNNVEIRYPNMPFGWIALAIAKTKGYRHMWHPLPVPELPKVEKQEVQDETEPDIVMDEDLMSYEKARAILKSEKHWKKLCIRRACWAPDIYVAYDPNTSGLTDTSINGGGMPRACYDRHYATYSEDIKAKDWEVVDKPDLNAPAKTESSVYKAVAKPILTRQGDPCRWKCGDAGECTHPSMSSIVICFFSKGHCKYWEEPSSHYADTAQEKTEPPIYHDDAIKKYVESKLAECTEPKTTGLDYIEAKRLSETLGTTYVMRRKGWKPSQYLGRRFNVSVTVDYTPHH